MRTWISAALLAAAVLVLGSCSAVRNLTGGSVATADALAQVPVKRASFLGGFFRPQGPPPFGVFDPASEQRAPDPYPAPTTTLFGAHGYCDKLADNGLSISSGYIIDKQKLADLAGLGAGWARTETAPFMDDFSHVDPNQPYRFADLDSAQCALERRHIIPLIGLTAGPVQYNVVPGTFSPASVKRYKTPADFGQWCSVVARHERATFADVHRYSLPGNEVNSPSTVFPASEPDIASYARACYRAVKAADPRAFVYGFELNMDRQADATGFVQRMIGLRCGPGTCYDGLSIHLTLRYPLRPAGTPCYPNEGGDYDMQCVGDIRSAARAPIHIIIGETVYPVPGSVPDEGAKARAVVVAMKTFAADRLIDGVNYANVDECDLYPSGYFAGGCLVDSLGTKLPAYVALRDLARAAYAP